MAASIRPAAYSQPGNLFRLMKPAQQQVLFENTARSVGGASQAIQQRHIDNCGKADPAYGAGVAAALRALKEGKLRQACAMR